MCFLHHSYHENLVKRKEETKNLLKLTAEGWKGHINTENIIAFLSFVRS